MRSLIVTALRVCRVFLDYGDVHVLLCKSQTPLRYLVVDRSEAGGRPAASWNLAYHLAR